MSKPKSNADEWIDSVRREIIERDGGAVDLPGEKRCQACGQVIRTKKDLDGE